MRRTLLIGCFLFIGIVSLNGCDKKQNLSLSESQSKSNESEQYERKEYTFTEDMIEIEDGFSYAEYDDNYGFEEFIQQGGAASDSEVIKFLAGNVFAIAETLSFAEEAYGCSTVSIDTAEEEHLFGRNFDWETCNALVLKSTPKEGYSSVSTVNTDFIRQGAGIASAFLSEEQQILAALYAPLDGMNKKGFCISVNMISDGDSINQETTKPDITTTTAVRLLLNQASTVDEAVSLLGQYDLHSSMGMMVHFAMADSTGESVVVEYVDNEMIVTDTPVVTNFYLSEGEKKGIGTKQSHERYDILMDTILNQKLSMEELRDALDSVSKDNFNDSATTEWSIVFNQTTGEIQYYHRENYKLGYCFSIN